MHRPSNTAVYLGKHMGWGWGGVPDDIKEQIEDLFEKVQYQEAEGNQEDFCVALDHKEENAPFAIQINNNHTKTLKS